MTTPEMSVPTGIGPLDERLGGLEAGRPYVLSAPPGPVRSAAVLQFVEAGLRGGGRAGLVTPVRPDRTFERAGRLGLDLRSPWEAGRLRLVGFREEDEDRLQGAGSAGEVFAELGELLAPVPEALAFDPGSVLWDDRADGVPATGLVDFVEDHGTTALATTSSDPDEGLPPALEMVAQVAAGVFRIETTDRGLVRLRIHRLDRAGVDPQEITLELTEDGGLSEPSGTPGRRASDPEDGTDGTALLLHLEAGLPEELRAWLADGYSVSEVDGALDLVSRIQDERGFTLALLHVERSRLDEARRACRVLRRMRPDLSVAVLSADRLRATDRAALLRAGADECLSAPLNVEEIASRLELLAGRPDEDEPGAPGVGGDDADPRARGAGAASAAAADDGTDAGAPVPGDGPLDGASFRAEVLRQLETRAPALFTVVRFPCHDPDALLAEIEGSIRADAGDFAGRLPGGCAVLLAGTHPGEAEGFAGRMEDAWRAAGGGEAGEVEILGGVRDGERLRSLLG